MSKLRNIVVVLGMLVSGCSVVENARALKEKQDRFDEIESVFSEAEAAESSDTQVEAVGENDTEEGSIGDAIDQAESAVSNVFRASEISDVPLNGTVTMEGGVLFGNDSSSDALLALLDGRINFGVENAVVSGTLSEVQQVDLTSSSNFDTARSARLFDGTASFEANLNSGSTMFNLTEASFDDQTISYRGETYLISFESIGQLYDDGADRWAVGSDGEFQGTLTNTANGSVVQYDEGKWGMIGHQ